MFTDLELQGIVALVDFCWRNGGVRSPQDAQGLENLKGKAITELKKRGAPEVAPEEKDAKKKE